MIYKKLINLFILFTAIYSFVGLSLLQGIIEFSKLPCDIEISLNMAEEEENHNSSNSEIKTIKEKQHSNFHKRNYFNKELVAFKAIEKDFLFLHQGFFEIFSPPPKA